MTRKIKLLFIIFTLLFCEVYFYIGRSYAATSVNDLQKKIDTSLDKKKETEKQLQAAQANLQKNQSQIGVTKSLIQTTQTEITRKENDIETLNNNIELNKKILANYIREAYYSDQDPTAELILSDSTINDITGNFDQVVSVKDKIISILGEIDDSKAQLEQAKAELSDKKDDHEKLYSIQQGQQYDIQSDITEAKATLQQLNAEIDKLRSKLSSLLGSAVSFKNIMDAAAFASKTTSVRKDYLLGVLVVESNLGRFTGGCNFKESRMSGYRADLFKNICKELKYDYTKQKVSCPPRGYRGTGGAMGVAQFMPDTWINYKSSIASVTGHNPPDPWSLADGVTAMALKLSKVSGVTSHNKSAEAKAYCVYLAGGNWQSYCDSKGVNYGAKVLYWADNYESVMN